MPTTGADRPAVEAATVKGQRSKAAVSHRRVGVLPLDALALVLLVWHVVLADLQHRLPPDLPQGNRAKQA